MPSNLFLLVMGSLGLLACIVILAVCLVAYFRNIFDEIKELFYALIYILGVK